MTNRAPTAQTLPRSGLGSSFWTVWTAGSISFIGDGLILGALPLLALTVTHDARLIAAIDAMTMMGWLLLGLLSGVIVDRAHKLRLMSLVDAMRAGVLGTLVVVILTGHLNVELLMLITLVLGMASPFFDNAAGAVVPELVTASSLEKANSWLQAPMIILATLIGPPLGALLFTFGGRGVPFGIDAASFALSAAILLPLAMRTRPPVPFSPEAGTGGMLREGLGYLRGHRLLRDLAIATGVANAVLGGVTAVLVLYVTEDMELAASAYGWIVATFAVGGVLGAVICGAVVRRVGMRAAVTGALFCFAVAITGLGVFPHLEVVLPAAALTGVAETIWSVTTISYRQRTAPVSLLGRVTSVYRMAAFIGIPLGAAAAGVLTHATTAQTAYLTGGLSLGVFAISYIPSLRGLPGREPHSASGPDQRA